MPDQEADDSPRIGDQDHHMTEQLRIWAGVQGFLSLTVTEQRQPAR